MQNRVLAHANRFPPHSKSYYCPPAFGIGSRETETGIL
jgi:hypothetical protein